MPHARHGASEVCSFAVAGSKFEATGFEKEQMGQIHVAFLIKDDVGADCRNGLPSRLNRAWDWSSNDGR